MPRLSPTEKTEKTKPRNDKKDFSTKSTGLIIIIRFIYYLLKT